MSLKRLYVADRLAAGARLRLGEDAARYLGRVLRLRTGDVMQVFNGDDGEWRATIERIGRNAVALTVTEPIPGDSEIGIARPPGAGRLAW